MAAAGTGTASNGRTTANSCTTSTSSPASARRTAAKPSIATTRRRSASLYHYFNSQGGYSEGDVQPAQNELRFPEERYEQDGKTMVLRTIWRFEGDAKMLAVTEQQTDGQWVEAWRIAFSRE